MMNLFTDNYKAFFGKVRQFIGENFKKKNKKLSRRYLWIFFTGRRICDFCGAYKKAVLVGEIFS